MIRRLITLACLLVRMSPCALCRSHLCGLAVSRRHPAPRGAARHGGGAHVHRRPACRRAGSARLLPRHRRQEAGGRQRHHAQGDGRRSRRLPARRARLPRPHRDAASPTCGRSRSAPCRSSTRSEPNSEFDKPQPIPLNITVHGVVDNEDVDHFVVECKKGQRLSVEVEGMRLGITFFDPYVAILDAKRFELATGDDSPLAAQDGGCSVVIPADGKYVVQVRESAYGGNGACQYRLHIGNFPRPTAVVPAGGKPGRGTGSHVPRRPGRADQAEGEAPGRRRPRLLAAPLPDARGHQPDRVQVPPRHDLPERRSKPGRTTPPPRPRQACRRRACLQRRRREARRGRLLQVHREEGRRSSTSAATPGRLGSPLDPVMYVGVLRAAAIAGNDDSGGPDSYFRFTAPDDKEYAVWVHDHLQKGGADYFYRDRSDAGATADRDDHPARGRQQPGEPGPADDHACRRAGATRRCSSATVRTSAGRSRWVWRSCRRA